MNQEIKPADLPLAIHQDETGAGADKPAIETDLLPSARPQPLAVAPARKPRRKLVTTLTLSSRTCKWPIGDPAKPDFHYCGLPPQSGRPYCETHDDMSYQPTPRRRAS
jgi:GcrA cell cycle regulator